jgi:lysophospholipase L1-like esterase
MYRFQLNANTEEGKSIALVGSTPALGEWDVKRAIPLRTSAAAYPLWWTELLDLHQSVASETSLLETNPNEHPIIEYKYFCLDEKDEIEWENWGSNRWLAIEPETRNQNITVDDGAFGYIQPHPFGYLHQAIAEEPMDENTDGLKIVIIGSSVAQGQKSWLLKGWAWQLAQTLKAQGHQVVNVSEAGANVGSTIYRFPKVVAPEKPDIVIIALSLGNEGLATCKPYERRGVQRRFESGLQHLVKMTRELGARPILGGLYPHGDYFPEHHWLLWDTHNRLANWGIPILNWLAVLGDGKGRWRSGASFDPAHPNTWGHQLMYQAIDFNLFQVTKAELAQERRQYQQQNGVPVYLDNNDFEISAWPEEKRLRIVNPSPFPYKIAPYWRELQTDLQARAGLIPGIYIAPNHQSGTLPYFSVSEDGAIETLLEIPPQTSLEYSAAFNLFSPNQAQLLFYDGHLGLLQEDKQHLRVINETEREYNVHPMWQEVQEVFKAMPSGVYYDADNPDLPFRTLMIGPDGLESRVKIPPKSSVVFAYRCPLSAISRVAILPLGARCAARMLLYKLEYDGPAFPFDLTRTTNLGDVADMIAKGFEDMWNPALLDYNAQEKRIYHRRWSGLSFAHEVEDHEDPVHNPAPIHARMYSRYRARSERFWYTIRHSDQLLFVRNGFCDRAGVIDLMEKLTEKCQGKPFRLLVLSPQSSEEYANLPQVIHYNLDFNPDRMYADVEHWLDCAQVMGTILTELGISSQNLFWCPPKISKAKQA